MKRIQEWLLFSIQLIVKMGFLGKYKLVSTATPEPDNKQGLKTLEKTILSLGKKNDALVVELAEVESGVDSLERTIIGLEERLAYVMIKNTEFEGKLKESEKKLKESEKKLSATFLENIVTHKSLQGKITELESTLEQASIMSEELRGEMTKWRT